MDDVIVIELSASSLKWCLAWLLTILSLGFTGSWAVERCLSEERGTKPSEEPVDWYFVSKWTMVSTTVLSSFVLGIALFCNRI